MIPTILSVAAKRDRICPALHGLCLFLFQGIQQAGRFRFFWLHGYREGRVLITESAYLKRTRRKRFHTVVRDRQDFRHHGIICDPDGAADQGRAGLKLLSPETDACTFVHQTFLMVQEGFRNHRSIQKSKRSGIPVPFLDRGDPSFRHRHTHTLIVFPDPCVRGSMVVFFQIVAPVTVQSFQCPDVVHFYFRQKSIYDLMKLFALTFDFPLRTGA